MAITELSDNEPLVTHVPALGHDLMVEGDVTGHPVHPLLRPLFPGGLRSEIYSLDGASDVGLGLLVNGWCGVVGMPELQGAQMRRWGGLMRHDWSWFRVPVVGWPPSLLS